MGHDLGRGGVWDGERKWQQTRGEGKDSEGGGGDGRLDKTRRDLSYNLHSHPDGIGGFKEEACGLQECGNVGVGGGSVLRVVA